MKTVCELNGCAGCMACTDICPKNAITIKDSLRFYNAIIDEQKCINCNLCHKICQECHMPDLKYPILWREGWAANPEIRMKSSSGGFATAITLAFVNSGGIVYSCSFINGQFIFTSANSEDGVKKFIGSKYVKSNPKGVYKNILMNLEKNKKVLLLGLPCQIAAAKNYVGDHEEFYTIDLICHGTPSPRILEKFLNEYRYSLTSIKDITFRVKDCFGLSNEKISFTVPTVQDYYTMTFLNSISYTENCYECKYARLERVSDLTLGDSWGSKLPKSEKNKGISLALCQTEKGLRLLKQTNLYMEEVNLENAVKYNYQLQRPSAKPIQREKFFTMMEAGKKFSRIVWRCYPNRYIKNSIKTILYKLKPFRDVGGGNIQTNYYLLINANTNAKTLDFTDKRG